jgi:hypothetical protein
LRKDNVPYSGIPGTAAQGFKPANQFVVMKDSEIREIAKNRVDFREHLYIYAAINVFLFALNMWLSPTFWWFLFVTFFWGIGLAFHFNEAYLGTREAKIENEYQKIRKTMKRK